MFYFTCNESRGIVCGRDGGEVTPPITKTSKYNPPNIYTTVNGNLESGYLFIIWIAPSALL